MINALSPAVFLDRDGTIMEDCDYCSDPKDVRIFSGVPEALRSLRSRGFKLIVITNQSGIGRGLMTVEQYRAVEAEVLRQLDELIGATYFCPDVPGQRSICRKPAPGMIQARTRDRPFTLVFHWRQRNRCRVRSQRWSAHGPRSNRLPTGHYFQHG